MVHLLQMSCTTVSETKSFTEICIFELTGKGRPVASAHRPAAALWMNWGTEATGGLTWKLNPSLTMRTWGCRFNINPVDENNEADSLLIELKAPQAFVFNNTIFFWDQTLWDTRVLKDILAEWVSPHTVSLCLCIDEYYVKRAIMIKQILI